jgi:outer membrane protein, multidrug efflux system
VNGILNWELDFWGRLRNATRAARAQMLASMEAYSLVRQTLVSDLARAYFELLDLDLELEFSRRSLEVREESLRLATLRVERGVASEIDQRQAEILVKTARATMITLERLREQKENQLRLLLGENPGPVDRGKGLMDQSVAVSLPVGLPSELLLNRPDIRAAEQRVIAANAQIGVARAAFFPRIALTAQAGYESASLLNILDGGNTTWVFGPTAALPIFNAGRLRSNLRAAEARKQASVLDYQRTVQQAFRDVADSLIGQRKLAEFRLEQEGLVESLRAASRLSHSRYRNGVSSYLEFLDSERQRLDAELRLAQARRDELVAAVQLYRSLGGGWQ